MTQEELNKIVREDGSLCNARFYGQVDTVVSHVNAQHPGANVTLEQAQAALDAAQKQAS